MSKARRSTKAAATATKPATVKYPKEVVQEALQTTFWLQGNLKSTRMAYLRLARELAKVRDRKLYEVLGHPDVESYAQQRLKLGRSSLYNYLRIHDWARKCHPAWLEPKPKGFIPDFSDIGDLMWIEEELERTDLTPARRATLEELDKKGLAGNLIRSEVRKLRKKENTGEGGLKTLISKLRLVRRRAAALSNLPPEALEHLDAAIEILANDKALRVACLTPLDAYDGKWCGNLLA
jgi:hypothetical protein